MATAMADVPSPIVTSFDRRSHRVLMYCLMAFGLFFPRHGGSAHRRLWIPLMVWSTAIIALILFNLVRLFATAYDGRDRVNEHLFVKTNASAWSLLCAVNAIVHFVMSYSRRLGMLKYYARLVQIEAEMSLLDSCRGPWRGTWKLNVASVIVGWILIVANVGYICPQLFDERGFEYWRVMTRLRPDNATLDSEHEALRYIMAATTVVGSGAWVWPVIFIFNVSLHLGNAFDGLNSYVKHLVQSDSACAMNEMGRCRLLHVRITRVVEGINRCLQVNIGAHILFSMLMTIIQLYNLMWSKTLREPENRALLQSYVVWLLGAVTMLSAEFVAASILADKARGATSHIHSFASRCDDVTNNNLLQMQLFINQLSQPIGFKAMGLFVISKEVSLALIGTWITYFLIILQYQA